MKHTLTQTKILRAALALTISLPALGLTGCTSLDLPFLGQDEEPVDVQAEETTNAPAPAETSEKSESPSSTKAPENPSSDQLPAGFTPSADGEQLSFGDTGYIVTTDFKSGKPQFWEVNVAEPQTLTLEELETDANGTVENPEEIKEFVCHEVTLKYLGAGESDATISAAPDVKPVSKQGQSANRISMLPEETACGIHDSEVVPTGFDDLKEGTEYKTAALSWVAVSGGLDADGVEVTGGDHNTDFEETRLYFY
ncbi:hypothetical protein QP027_09440 [Corynebacterium breve]|uniref:Secreted protein n=1 Tax=Corynebacterium breve TaxID=3049799 RepID=A0ABY8VCF5_9CORY|nr:hypothetical protein [Corynebacterium breve]WIM67321.1 hypothetical protein QP027_09440 [Corynebacterium breve]